MDYRLRFLPYFHKGMRDSSSVRGGNPDIDSHQRLQEIGAFIINRYATFKSFKKFKGHTEFSSHRLVALRFIQPQPVLHGDKPFAFRLLIPNNPSAAFLRQIL